MQRIVALASIALACSASAKAAEPCQRIYGRAIYYTGDGQFPIWHIGTHHTFSPAYPRLSAEDFDDTWEPVMELLRKGGGTDTEAFDRNALFADFLICPTEQFRDGATQPAVVKHIYHSHIVPRDRDGERR